MRKKIENQAEKIKSKGLFDHIKHIRVDKSKDYYNNLTDAEKKTFVPYMILRVLSMDKSIIDEVAYISKYFDKMDGNSFYKLCRDIVPYNKSFFPYIKSSSNKYNKELLEIISKKFETSMDTAKEYCDIFYKNTHTIHELREIIYNYGYSDKEAKKIMEIK